MSNTVAQVKLDAIGIEAVCEAIADGRTLTDIAKQCEVSIGALSNWLTADVERSARAREARAATARMWDEKAERCIQEAYDSVGVSKARELAHHYRWRASKIAPREYGDKVAVEHSGEVALKDVSDEQLDARIAQLLGTAGAAGAAGGTEAPDGPAED